LFLALLTFAAAWPKFHCPVDFEYTDNQVTLTFKNKCGMPHTLNIAPSYFDVISFNGFVASTGDVEGSLLCNTFNVGAGYTVGWGLPSTDAYGLVVNGDATFVSGDVQPNGNTIYVGENFNAPSYLTSRRVPCNGTTIKNGWSSVISAASTNYETLTNDLKSQSVTVSYALSYNTFHVVKFTGKAAQLTYFLNINVNDFNTINAYSFDALANEYVPNGILCINVIGKGTVTFNGGQFPSGFIGHVIYNIPTATHVVVNTGVWGDILAPYAALNQTGGVIWGKVVVNDIVQALQINRPVCPTTQSNTPKKMMPLQ